MPPLVDLGDQAGHHPLRLVLGAADGALEAALLACLVAAEEHSDSPARRTSLSATGPSLRDSPLLRSVPSAAKVTQVESRIRLKRSGAVNHRFTADPCDKRGHTHAADLAEAGPVNFIQDQLGHARLAVTDRYLRHITPAPRIEAIQRREWRS